MPSPKPKPLEREETIEYRTGYTYPCDRSPNPSNGTTLAANGAGMAGSGASDPARVAVRSRGALDVEAP